MKRFFALLLTVPLSGCGTFTTLSSTDEEIARDLKQNKTLCETTSRAYGGVSYNFCKLHSARSSVNFDFVLAFYLLDTGVSALTDTAFLPFTVYQQSELGSIELGGEDS